MSNSMVNENLRESREGSKVRQGIAGCSPAGVKDMKDPLTTCLRRDGRNVNEVRLSRDGNLS